MSTPQRQREEAADTSDLSGEEDEDYVPYVPVKQRKQQMVTGPGAGGEGLRVSPLTPARGSHSVLTHFLLAAEAAADAAEGGVGGRAAGQRERAAG